jgi:hypothetical protein
MEQIVVYKKENRGFQGEEAAREKKPQDKSIVSSIVEEQESIL